MATLSNLDTSASVFQPQQLLNWVNLNLSPIAIDNQHQGAPHHGHQQQITATTLQNGNYNNMGNTGNYSNTGSYSNTANYSNTTDLWINPNNNMNHINVSKQFFSTSFRSTSADSFKYLMINMIKKQY